MDHSVLIGVISIYASVALPALAYVIRIESRLTRIETKLNGSICPLVEQSSESNGGQNYD